MTIESQLKAINNDVLTNAINEICSKLGITQDELILEIAKSKCISYLCYFFISALVVCFLWSMAKLAWKKSKEAGEVYTMTDYQVYSGALYIFSFLAMVFLFYNGYMLLQWYFTPTVQTLKWLLKNWS